MDFPPRTGTSAASEYGLYMGPPSRGYPRLMEKDTAQGDALSWEGPRWELKSSPGEVSACQSARSFGGLQSLSRNTLGRALPLCMAPHREGPRVAQLPPPSRTPAWLPSAPDLEAGRSRRRKCEADFKEEDPKRPSRPLRPLKKPQDQP